MKRSVLIVVGTRPEVIKMVPVYLAMRQSGTLFPILLSTGQHREMLDQSLAAFEIQPDHDLKLMTQGQTLTSLTALVLSEVGAFLEEHQPDAILVQGDTTTVMASAMAAFYHRIPVGHVEAGLRTYDMQSPWPEEMNRRVVAPIARWHFVPTHGAEENLVSERVAKERVFVTGNTVVDSLLRMKERLIGNDKDRMKEAFSPLFYDRFLSVTSSMRWILVTGHRRESFGDGFERICQALRRLVDSYEDLGIIYPVHLNPRVNEPVNRLLGDHERIALIEPVGYASFVWLMSKCHFVLSDSGGVQEEAPSLGKPVLVMRKQTERNEGVKAGTSRLVGTDVEMIVSEAGLLLDDDAAYSERAAIANPYGDGKAAERIVTVLEGSLK